MLFCSLQPLICAACCSLGLALFRVIRQFTRNALLIIHYAGIKFLLLKETLEQQKRSWSQPCNEALLVHKLTYVL